MSDAVTPTAAERRKFGVTLLGIAVALAILFVGFTLLTRQWWMLAFLLLIIPNIYMGVRELRASKLSGPQV